MAIPIRIKRSAVPGKIPTTDQLKTGELALNFYDGDLYAKRIRPGVGTDVVNLAAGVRVKNVLYVTKDGNDNNTGKKLGDAKATIKGAVEISEEGTVIRVASGVYEEDNPIKLPPQVSIIGDSLREVTVTPKNPGDLFHVSPGNYISDMSFIGESDPGRAICAFDPDNVKYFLQSPYIRNCTNFIPDSIGLKIDGNYAIGPLKSMVLDSYTQYNQGGIGISITNEGYAQLVSLFTIAPDTAVYVSSGAACDLTNSNSSFGNYGLVADGVSRLKYTGIISSFTEAGNDTFILDLSTPEYNVVDASYDNVTGILDVTTSEPHKFSVGMGVSIVGLGFTCPFEVGIRTYPSGKNGYVFQVRTVAPGRYLDAADSIDSNRQEIIDKSLAEIAIQYDGFTNTNFYFPGEEPTNPRSRYYDATRLIQKNKSVIVGAAWTATFLEYPEIAATESICKRDLGFFVDAISTDVFTGGNKYSRDFSLQYFTGTAAGSLIDEEQQTIYAFNQAREFMKSAITNTLVGAAYSDLTISTGPSTYSGPGPIYSNTSSNACFDVQQNINTLVGIVTNVIGSGSTVNAINFLGTFDESLGTFTDGAKKCARDLGYIVDAVSSDVREYTNRSILKSTKAYFNKSGTSLLTTGISSEKQESIVAFRAVGEYSKKAINNQLNNKNLSLAPDLLTGSNVSPLSCTNVKNTIDTLVGILTTFVAAENLSGLPPVFMESNVFSAYVGTSTLPHTYNSGGLVKINVIRPFDGQVIYFEDLYYTVNKINLISGGSGYISQPVVTIDPPDTPWGVSAQAVAVVEGGTITGFEIVSNGRGYTSIPKVTIYSTDVGINTSTATCEILPTYYSIIKSTLPSPTGICTIIVNENVPYDVGIGTEVPFFKQSRVLASGHSFEFIGSGTEIPDALPFTGGVPIQENETDSRNGGLVVYTSTDQSGNFRIGDGVVVNQNTGTISGTFYSKSLFATVTPFILALGGP